MVASSVGLPALRGLRCLSRRSRYPLVALTGSLPAARSSRSAADNWSGLSTSKAASRVSSLAAATRSRTFSSIGADAFDGENRPSAALPDDPAFHAIPHPPVTSSSVATTSGVRPSVDVLPSACLSAVTTLAAAGDRTPAVVLSSTSQGPVATTAAPGVFLRPPPSTGLVLMNTSAGSRILALVQPTQRFSWSAFRIPRMWPPIQLVMSRLPPPPFRLILPEPPSACRLLLPFSPPELKLYSDSGFTTDDDRTQHAPGGPRRAQWRATTSPSPLPAGPRMTFRPALVCHPAGTPSAAGCLNGRRHGVATCRGFASHPLANRFRRGDEGRRGDDRRRSSNHFRRRSSVGIAWSSPGRCIRALPTSRTVAGAFAATRREALSRGSSPLLGTWRPSVTGYAVM